MTPAARIGRPAALALVGLCAALFCWGVLLGAASDRPEPVLSALTGDWTEEALRAAAGEIPVAWLQGYFLAIQLLPAAAGLTAALLLLRGAQSWFRCYAAVVLALFGTMNGAMPAVLQSSVGGWIGDLLYGLNGLAWVSLFPLMYVFPDGHIRPRWGRWALVGWLSSFPTLPSCPGSASTTRPAGRSRCPCSRCSVRRRSRRCVGTGSSPHRSSAPRPVASSPRWCSGSATSS